MKWWKELVAKRSNRGEFALIERYFAPLSRDYPYAFGLKDDVAAVRLRKTEELIVTSDAMVGGVHFFRDDPIDQVAQKLLRSNLSDLAAKGAMPLAYTLVTAWPRKTSEKTIATFAQGLKRDQIRFGIDLMGGDTVATDGPASFSITAFGTLPRGIIPLRAKAKVGHDIWVSGFIGDAHLGLSLRRKDLLQSTKRDRDYLLKRHRLPEPRLTLGQNLRGMIGACCDVSDGLIADLNHICAASSVAAEIEASRIPLSKAAQKFIESKQITLAALISGGDDYELCFTANSRYANAIEQAACLTGVPVAQVGKIVRGRGVRLRDSNGRNLPMKRLGYSHFL